MGHLYDLTGAVRIYLIYYPLDQTLTMEVSPLMVTFKEVSHSGRLVLRSYDNPIRISHAGFERATARARYFSTEGRVGSGADKVTVSIAPLDTSKVKKIKDPKPDACVQSEEGKTMVEIPSTAIAALRRADLRSSETNQNKRGPVTKKGGPQDGKPPKPNSDGSWVKDLDLDMLAGMPLEMREKHLGKEIRRFWSEKDKRFVNISKLIFSKEVLILAYAETIRAKGATTKAGDCSSLDGITLEKLETLSKQLLNGSWRPGISRRIMIPKKTPGEFRPLTIVPAFDKIVCNAIKLVISYIYEPSAATKFVPPQLQFAVSSHGSRPLRSCHSALNVTLTWGLSSWLIKGDISKCYDTIDQKRLYNILRKLINDQMLIDVLCKVFSGTVKNLEAGGPDCSKGIGVPQGNPLSPLLANIYLSELDYFVAALKGEHDKGKPGTNETTGWHKATWVSAKELSGAKTKEAKANLKRDLYRGKVKQAIKAGIARRVDSDANPKVYHKIHYVRYADDYLLAIKGPKSLALKVKFSVENFLKSSLHFGLKGGNLVHAKSDTVNFLGFDIKVPGRDERAVVETRRILSFKKLRNRVLNRKRALEERLTNALRKAYESKVKGAILDLSKRKLDKDARAGALDSMATEEAETLVKLAEAKGKAWIPTAGPLSLWMKQEASHLRESWIKEEEFKSLGLEVVVEKYDQFVVALESAVSAEKLQELKDSEIARIKTNPNYKQMHVDRILYGQSQGLNPKLYAPLNTIKARLVTWGMLSKVGRPKASGAVFKYHDVSIVEFFKQKALGLLSYYRPANNYHSVKKFVDYHMRWSLIHTLAGKHLMKVHEVISKYGKTPAVTVLKEGKATVVCRFLSPNDINLRTRGFTTAYDPREDWHALDKPIVKLSIPKVLFVKKCAVLRRV